jgi:hypothetical protein
MRRGQVISWIGTKESWELGAFVLQQIPVATVVYVRFPLGDHHADFRGD